MQSRYLVEGDIAVILNALNTRILRLRTREHFLPWARGKIASKNDAVKAGIIMTA